MSKGAELLFNKNHGKGLSGVNWTMLLYEVMHGRGKSHRVSLMDLDECSKEIQKKVAEFDLEYTTTVPTKPGRYGIYDRYQAPHGRILDLSKFQLEAYQARKDEGQVDIFFTGPINLPKDPAMSKDSGDCIHPSYCGATCPKHKRG